MAFGHLRRRRRTEYRIWADCWRRGRTGRRSRHRVKSSCTILVDESASAGSTRAPRPCALESCANSTAAASSSGVRPARQSTGASPCQSSGRSAFCTTGRLLEIAASGTVSTAAAASASMVGEVTSGIEIILGGKIAGKLGNGVANLGHARLVQGSALGIGLGQLKAPQATSSK